MLMVWLTQSYALQRGKTLLPTICEDKMGIMGIQAIDKNIETKAHIKRPMIFDA
jgi:hypothetical protein